MATVGVHCPEHGSFDLDTQEVIGLAFRFPSGNIIHQCRFHCPEDGAIVNQNIPWKFLSWLKNAGAQGEYYPMRDQLLPQQEGVINQDYKLNFEGGLIAFDADEIIYFAKRDGET